MHIVKEEPAMPRTTSFKKGNYSHCPLKKRPVHVLIKEESFVFIKEEKEKGSSNDAMDESPEPENLSTKPEDLTCKSAMPPIGVALISCKKETEDLLAERHDEPPLGHGHHFEATGGHFMGKAAGPLEPLNLNTQQELVWPKPYYPPPHYLPLNYSYPPPQFYHYYGDKYPAAPAVASPPHQSYAPSLPQPRPIYVPATYSTAAPPECGLSPTSSTSSLSHGVYSYPPSTPEDLSSPGSVVSSGGCSPTRKRKDVSPRYKCNFCSKSYSTYSGLSKHQQFHCSANEDSSSAKKTFSCKDCDKVYVSLGALKMHIRTHTLPCKCKLCGKAFSRPWLLQGHIRTHTGEKPFTCPHCNRAFADRSNLRAHLQTHSDIKKYSCVNCSKTFSRMSLLTKHTESGCPGSHHSPNPSDDSLYHHQEVYSS